MADDKERDLGNDKAFLVVQMTKEEKKRLKAACVDLGISITEFIKRLLAGSLPMVDTEREKGKDV